MSNPSRTVQPYTQREEEAVYIPLPTCNQRLCVRPGYRNACAKYQWSSLVCTTCKCSMLPVGFRHFPPNYQIACQLQMPDPGWVHVGTSIPSSSKRNFAENERLFFYAELIN